MKSILLHYTYLEGIGDTLISIFDIVHLSKHISETYPEVNILFYINHPRPGSSLEYMLDFEEIDKYFKEVKIFKQGNIPKIKKGTLQIEDKEYTRLFSCNNDDLFNSINGCFDIFCLNEDVEYFNNLDIAFREFILTLDSKNIPDYPILNKKVLADADVFVKQNFNSEFESIFYREFTNPDFEQINIFFDKLLPKLDVSKSYFFCTNHIEVRKIFEQSNLNLVCFKPFDKFSTTRISNGYVQDLDDLYYALVEMVILSKSKKIYTGISRSYVSLFNFYATSIHNVPLDYIQTQ